MSFTHPATGERLALALRTSMHSEYRNPASQLCAFEVNRAHVSFGALCATLAKHSGVEFVLDRAGAWYPRPARFTYKGFAFHVAIPFADYWVGPVEAGDTYSALEELLFYVKMNVLHHRLTLIRSHYANM